MISVGVQGALAIKRKRHQTHVQNKARKRRYSIQSNDSEDSTQTAPETKVTSICLLHIGVLFIVLGFFLIGAGILPDDMENFNLFAFDTWFNELVCTGVFSLIAGVFLIVLNSLISKREEHDLEQYVQRQLTKSRSGHRLEWDVETGGLTTRHQRKPMMAKDVSYTQLTPVTSEMVTPTTPIAGDGESCSDVLLEKIVEEETSPSEGPTSSIASPGSDEKYLLLRNGGHSHSVTVTKI